MIENIPFLAFLITAFLSFVVSASAGMGGSLILVPALAIMFGGKTGIVLAALMLGGNNIFKVIAYRKSIPVKQSLFLVLAAMLGALIGASLLLDAPEILVDIGVVAALIIAFGFELRSKSERLHYQNENRFRKRLSPFFAFFGGASSGFSGTSGPLKGIALRSQNFDRFHLVGAASLVSLCGDFTKTVVFFNNGNYAGETIMWALAAIPVMFLGTTLGKNVNRELGERYFALVFWFVMASYGVRLAFV